MNEMILKKKFSVGLSLKESIEDIESFLKEYNEWLNSIFFSVPLGRKYYSRGKLAEEYDGNEKKMISVLKLIRRYGIRLELALNTSELTSDDLENALKFCVENDVVPEEVVCLKEYAAYIRNKFPKCELKYSFNNHDTWMKHVSELFDTIIIGKALLRDMEKINSLSSRYNIIYMLNNGCSYVCGGYCSRNNCYKMYEVDIGIKGIDYSYARSSIFPSELKGLLLTNPNSKNFKFKISNRPFGLEYTKKVLNAYISLEDPIDELKRDKSLFTLFSSIYPLAEHTDELNIENVLNYKKELGLYL